MFPKGAFALQRVGHLEEQNACGGDQASYVVF
jgi:hypothetical protein